MWFVLAVAVQGVGACSSGYAPHAVVAQVVGDTVTVAYVCVPPRSERMFYRPELGQDYVPAIEQRQELHKTITLTPMGPSAPAIEQRPEQMAYTAAVAAGATDAQARAAARRVVAKNNSTVARFSDGIPGVYVLAAIGGITLLAQRRPKRRRSRRSRRR